MDDGKICLGSTEIWMESSKSRNSFWQESTRPVNYRAAQIPFFSYFRLSVNSSAKTVKHISVLDTVFNLPKINFNYLLEDVHV
jgi:hypothetical protein